MTTFLIFYVWMAGVTFGIGSGAAQEAQKVGDKKEVRLTLLFALAAGAVWPITWVLAVGFAMAKVKP